MHALEVIKAVLAVSTGSLTPIPPIRAGSVNRRSSCCDMSVPKTAGQKVVFILSCRRAKEDSQFGMIRCTNDHSNCRDFAIASYTQLEVVFLQPMLVYQHNQ